MQGPPGEQGSGIDQEQDPLWNTRVGTCTASHNLEVRYFTSCLYLAYEIKNQQLYFSPKVLEVQCGKAGACFSKEQHLLLFHSNVNIVPPGYSLRLLDCKQGALLGGVCWSVYLQTRTPKPFPAPWLPQDSTLHTDQINPFLEGNPLPPPPPLPCPTLPYLLMSDPLPSTSVHTEWVSQAMAAILPLFSPQSPCPQHRLCLNLSHQLPNSFLLAASSISKLF